MEEAPKRRRAPLLVALAGPVLLAAIWATMALAGNSAPAAKPAAKAKAAPTQKAGGWTSYGPMKARGEDCPNKRGTSSDL